MADAKPEKSSVTMFIVVMLLLTIAGGGAGVIVGSLTSETGESAVTGDAPVQPQAVPKAETGHPAGGDGHDNATTAAETEAAQPAEDEHPKLAVHPFPAVLTNIANPKSTWLRLEGSLLIVEETEEKPEILVAKASEQILTYLRSVRLDQIEGPSGLLGLREDMNDMVAVLSDGQVREVIIHSLVVE